MCKLNGRERILLVNAARPHEQHLNKALRKCNSKYILKKGLMKWEYKSGNKQV